MLAHQRHRVGVLMRILLVLALSASCATASPARRFAATSSAVITIKKDDSSFFGASASDNDWGATLPPQKSRDRAFYPLVYTTPSLSDPFGCSSPEALANKTNKSNIAFQLPTKPFVLLVDRGGCAYSLKALYAKQLGAAALLVTDTQQQAYNRTLAADATPESKALEFSCANGHAEIEAREAHKMTDFTAPRWDERVNALRCASSPSCDSSMCIPSSASGRQVCCLWDVADPMGFSATSNGVNITKDDVADLPVVKLLIEDGIALKSLLTNFTAAKEELLITLYVRKAPMADPSQFIIWLLAIITVMIGGYKGATAERERALRKQSLLAEREANAAGADHTSDSMMNESMMTGTTAPLAREESQNEADALEDETLDLNMYHALAFVVFATAFLLVLFYWNIVLVVVIFFAIGSVSCSYYILWQPLFERMAVLRKEPFAKNPPTSSFLQSLEIQTWRIADMLAFVWSLGVSVLWFVCRNRQYAWMLQDVFGVCLCILFLRTIRLPNLKVATFMLVLVFLYDIFMVFLSGYIFSKSLMISAATGGSQGEPTVGSDYCLRYPTDTAHKCMKESMPILLRFPKVIDWRAGQSMLGLGDIVLPGLLVVFCARFDYATRGQLLGRVKGPHLARLKASHHDLTNDLPDLPESEVGSVPSQRQRPQNHQPHLAELSMPAASRRGLFGIMMWGYAVGLMLANIGVMVMKEGQPALMYLVPCTLGVLYIVAWRRGILKKLWDGPEEFRAHGTETVTTERSMTMRERGFTVDHVIQEHDDDGSSILEISNNNDTPVSTYARPEGTPKHR